MISSNENYNTEKKKQKGLLTDTTITAVNIIKETARDIKFCCSEAFK